jgi:hypothetical protein
VARLARKGTAEREERHPTGRAPRRRVLDGRILGGVSDPQPEGTETPRSRPVGPVVGTVVWLAGSVAAFTLLDSILATFVCILGLTIVAMAFFSTDWVRSTTFEEREAERVRRRKAKWDAGAAARERDRARWESHQARRTGRSDTVDG